MGAVLDGDFVGVFVCFGISELFAGVFVEDFAGVGDDGFGVFVLEGVLTGVFASDFSGVFVKDHVGLVAFMLSVSADFTGVFVEDFA